MALNLEGKSIEKYLDQVRIDPQGEDGAGLAQVLQAAGPSANQSSRLPIKKNPDVDRPYEQHSTSQYRSLPQTERISENPVRSGMIKYKRTSKGQIEQQDSTKLTAGNLFDKTS